MSPLWKTRGVSIPSGGCGQPLSLPVGHCWSGHECFLATCTSGLTGHTDVTCIQDKFHLLAVCSRAQAGLPVRLSLQLAVPSCTHGSSLASAPALQARPVLKWGV